MIDIDALWSLPMPSDDLPPGTADRLSPSATGPYGSLDYVARDVYVALRAVAVHFNTASNTSLENQLFVVFETTSNYKN